MMATSMPGDRLADAHAAAAVRRRTGLRQDSCAPIEATGSASVAPYGVKISAVGSERAREPLEGRR